jgi:hypothetical protein
MPDTGLARWETANNRLLIRFGFAAARYEKIQDQSREQPNQHLSEDRVH